MFARIFKALYHICWYGIAGVIILAAIAITLLRLALPDIGQYRHDIEIWISNYMGYPVEIRSIDASWEGWVPNLYLDDINVINAEDGDSLIRFKQASITLDPVASLRQREFIPYDVRVSGLDLTLIRHEDGAITLVKADAARETSREELKQNELGRWFRKQKHIEIADVDIKWVDRRYDLAPVQFEEASIRIHSDEDRMQVTGSANVNQQSGIAQVEYALDIHGHLHTSEWSGDIYINADNVDPGYWRQHFAIEGISLGHSTGRIQAWSEWNKARLVQLDSQITWETLQINNNPMQGIDGRVHLTRNRNDDWFANLVLNEFTTKFGVWPELTAEIFLPSGTDRFVRASVDYLKLDDVTAMLQSHDILQSLGLQDYTLTGDLTNCEIKVSLDNDHPYLWVDSDLDHIALRDPGRLLLAGVSGHITMDNDNGRVYLDSDKSEVSLQDYYDDSIWLYNTRGTVSWARDNDSLTLSTDSLHGETSDFGFALAGKLQYLPDNERMVDLLAGFSPVNTAKIADYLPDKGNGELTGWLRNAIFGGRLLNTDIVLRGPLSKFPFDNNEGTFQLITQMEKVTLDYDPEWPPIDNLSAEVAVNNRSLEVNAESGNVFSSTLSDTVARIPDMTTDKPHVLMTGTFDGNTHDLSLFVNQSPLNDLRSLEVVSREELTGPLKLELDLDIPLYDKDTAIDGRLHLLNNQLQSSDIGIALSGLKGTVDFTRDNIESKDLKGRYFDSDIFLSIGKPEGSTDDDTVLVNLQGTMDRDFLRKQFNHYFPNSTVMVNEYIAHFTGTSSWQASLAINGNTRERSGDRLNIHSDLVGMEIDLPAPLAKEKNSPLPIQISTLLQDTDKQLLDFQIGNVLAARLEYTESAENVIDALRVNFGGDINDLTSTEGIRIHGQLDEVSLSEWVNLIKKNMQARDTEHKTNYDNILVNVGINRLEFFNQLFEEVKLGITKPDNDWQINVDSRSIAGLINIPSGGNVIVLDMKRLHLQESGDEQSEPVTNVDPARMPSIHAHVKNVVYGNKDLGEMYLETSRLEKGLSFDELTFNKADLEINGYGEWVRENNLSVSRFTFEIDAEKLNDMLSTFGFNDAAIRNGKTYINLEAQWHGRPVDFALANINGRLDMRIEKGQFLDIDPKAGRLFGLLSLQTLPRRLALDFTDVFGEGLTFDSIEGVFTIENGNAYTNDLVLTGPSANIAVTGRTGLIEKDYDQIVTVTPQISSSLPVASALFGPIGVGVGAVIYFAGELFQSIPEQIDRILQYQYTITGSWEDPVVKELNDRKAPERASG